MNGRWIPNLITTCRIALSVPLGVLIVEERHVHALGVMVVAGLSDGLDGWLARRFNWQTRLGARLDPLADKLLVGVTYGALAWAGVLPWWLTALVIGRDLVIIAGAALFQAVTGRLEMAPSLLSKLNTTAQIALAIVAVLHAGIVTLPFPLLHGLISLVAAMTLASGLSYVWAWTRKAREGVR